MPIDPRRKYYPDDNVRDPAAHAVIAVPSDTQDLAEASRALLIGASGDLRVTTVGGETLTFPVLAGLLLPLMVARIHATGTTAAPVMVLW
jgi:hypothetical protein